VGSSIIDLSVLRPAPSDADRVPDRAARLGFEGDPCPRQAPARPLCQPDAGSPCALKRDRKLKDCEIGIAAIVATRAAPTTAGDARLDH